jgi:hypothetical protein
MYLSLLNEDAEEILQYGDSAQIKKLCGELIDKNYELEKIKETFESGEGEHETQNALARELIENIEFILQRAITGHPYPIILDRAIDEIKKKIENSDFKKVI